MTPRYHGTITAGERRTQGASIAGAIDATEDVLSRRSACCDSRGFIAQQPPGVHSDGTAWTDKQKKLGRQDSNLRMAGPKPAALPLGYAPTPPIQYSPSG